MTESEFWIALEFRICREFGSMRDPELRQFWCDGFIPETYELEANRTIIKGRVWMAHGREQWPWDFSLVIAPPIPRREEINWQMLLPSEDVTGWLSMNHERRTIQIHPAAARPDRL